MHKLFCNNNHDQTKPGVRYKVPSTGQSRCRLCDDLYHQQEAERKRAKRQNNLQAQPRSDEA